VGSRITQWDELRGVSMDLHGGTLRHASVRYAIAPVGNKQTEVIYTGEGELRGALLIFTPFMPALGRSDERKNLATLKRLLETPGLGTQDAPALYPVARTSTPMRQTSSCACPLVRVQLG
jgi:hypothetical protein